MDDFSLQREINMALPELDGETVETLTEHLRDIIGVRKKEDLLYAESEDVKPFFTPIQSRRLIQAFRKGEYISVYLMVEVILCTQRNLKPVAHPLWVCHWKLHKCYWLCDTTCHTTKHKQILSDQ